MKLCKCGCGNELIIERNKNGPLYYIRGHSGGYKRDKRGEYKTRYHGVCYCCGETKNDGYYYYRNHDLDDNALCGLCYRRLILNPKWGPITRKKWNPIVNKRKQQYKCKQIYIGHNPRKGICCWCFRFNIVTHMAHLKGYHDDDPTYGTYELCVRCHKRFDKKLFHKFHDLEEFILRRMFPECYIRKSWNMLYGDAARDARFKLYRDLEN